MMERTKTRYQFFRNLAGKRPYDGQYCTVIAEYQSPLDGEVLALIVQFDDGFLYAAEPVELFV